MDVRHCARRDTSSDHGGPGSQRTIGCEGQSAGTIIRFYAKLTRRPSLLLFPDKSALPAEPAPFGREYFRARQQAARTSARLVCATPSLRGVANSRGASGGLPRSLCDRVAGGPSDVVSGNQFCGRDVTAPCIRKGVWTHAVELGRQARPARHSARAAVR